MQSGAIAIDLFEHKSAIWATLPDLDEDHAQLYDCEWGNCMLHLPELLIPFRQDADIEDI